MAVFQLFFRGIALTLVALIGGKSSADGPVIAVGPNGQPVQVQRVPTPATQPAKPGGEAKQPQGESEADKRAEKKSEQKSPEPKVIRCDLTNQENADPEELNAMVGKDGRVAFQFRNQP